MLEKPEQPIFGPEDPRLDPPNPPEVKPWRSVAKAVSDLGLLSLLAFLLNCLFAVLYMLLQQEAGDDAKYKHLFGPIRWFLYAARNAVLYQQFDDEEGYLP